MKSWLIKVADLNLSDRQEMFELLTSYFKDVTWDVFQTDLNRKNWALLVKDETSSILKGFSTCYLLHTCFAGEAIDVVYSGDTIVDPSAWTSTILPRAWIASINFLHHQYCAQTKLYWLLICSGFRTYRFLPTFWKEFYPRYDGVTPACTAALIDHLAQVYYGDFYQPATGIVRFPHPQILQDSLIEIPKGRQSNSHIRFFEANNPGYRQGDELVCLTEVRYDNLTRAGQRMWQAQSLLENLMD
ncbi:N-acetyltransferase domain-containing protein [Tumidithrix helvetica PCC 7403]|uniref:hypothetical protein n=1 Tax=Tumidithrix helvetica TaxID=3457545 RepID=UPI003CB17133